MKNIFNTVNFCIIKSPQKNLINQNRIYKKKITWATKIICGWVVTLAKGEYNSLFKVWSASKSTGRYSKKALSPKLRISAGSTIFLMMVND